MWSVIPSLAPFLQDVAPAFTAPSFQTHLQLVLAWIMCLGKHTEFRVFESSDPTDPVDRTKRHPFDRFYNFFGRSTWQVKDLARRVAICVMTRLRPSGVLRLVVDETVLKKSGKKVFGIGWFHDSKNSTKKRVATTLGNSWVVIGLAIRMPFTDKVFCLTLHAKQRLPGKHNPGPADLAHEMLQEILEWFPNRQFELVGDGGFSAKELLKDLDQRVEYTGRMRKDAALFSTKIPPRKKGQRGKLPKKGRRLSTPKAMFQRGPKKNRQGQKGPKTWQGTWEKVEAEAYGEKRLFWVLTFEAFWPRVFGERAIQVVLVRPVEKGYEDVVLYTTDLSKSASEVIVIYAERFSIEVMFKESKQVLEIEAPQHWCENSISKLAPWVWLLQSILTTWYLKVGRELPEAEAARERLGEWDTEWSLRHILRLVHDLTLREKINSNSGIKAELHQLIQFLENYLKLAL